MRTTRHPDEYSRDPATCPHRRLRRIGIQRSPVSPRRLYLLTCLDCGTTITTRSLRDKRDLLEEEPGQRRAG